MPYLDEQGQPVQPEKENALKFELFIFDVLPLAERWTVVETSRREEFAPLKNATGADSPETVQQAISDLAADWLEQAGVKVPRQAGRRRGGAAGDQPAVRPGRGGVGRARWTAASTIDGPTYFG